MSDFNFELRFYEDQYEGAEDYRVVLDAAIRVIYVLGGSIEVDEDILTVGQGVLTQGRSTVLFRGGSAKLARWELVPFGVPNSNPVAVGCRSINKRTDFIHVPGVETGIRLDTVTFPPGTRAYRHVHVSSGIRYIVHGTLEINTDESRELMEPGHAWFEAVNSPVLAIADEDVETQFIRMMVLPVDHHGKLTITYVDPNDDDKPREQINNRILDEIVQLA